MNVELNRDELQLIIDALDDKHNAYANSGAEVLPKLQAVNRLYNRLSELNEEHEKSRLEIFAKGLARESLRQAANRVLSLQDVRQAYNRVRGRQLGSAVFISDLATELQIGLPKLHEWIRREVINSGRGSLDDGHWPTATESQRAAAIEHFGSKRLLIRFSQPDHVAVVKEHVGQVKTLAGRNREQDDGADNEIDGGDAIKLYNELVKSPEDRLALEKELPALVAARDKAVTAAKRKQIQRETVQIPEHVAQDAQVSQEELSI
jgi:hypothetical protein